MKTGVELIAAERVRQVESEGWTPEHDDEHDNGDLALAASGYAWPKWFSDPRITEPTNWPHSWDYKSDTRRLQGRGKQYRASRIRDLVKAGALIAAEIDRLQRITEGKL